MAKKLNKYFFDADAVNAAVSKAREHAAAQDKPLNLARVALYLGITTEEFHSLIDNCDANGGSLTKEALSVLKQAKQEAQADICDRLADKGNVTGYMFIGKCHHGMIETERREVEFKGVVFQGEGEIPD